MTPPSRPANRAQALDMIDWYRRCLEDVIAKSPVRGLDEAKLGYDAAMDWFRAAKRRMRVTYRSDRNDAGYTGNYVQVSATSPREAVTRRLESLGGELSCAAGSGFECEGEWFPVRWTGHEWALVEDDAPSGAARMTTVPSSASESGAT